MSYTYNHANPDNIFFSLQKSRFLADICPLGDGLLMYNDEDQYSPVGSLDNCSILEADNSLDFLSDLDLKFMKLAMMCSPPPKLEQIEQNVKSVNTSMIPVDTSECSVTTSAVQTVKSDQPAPQQSSIPNVTESINKSESINTSSTLLVQQQPLYCLVEHQAPTTVLFAEEPLQGMYLIKGLAGGQGLVLQGGNIPQNTLEQQGMYVIDGMSMLPGNIMVGNCSSLVSAGGLAASPVLVQGEKVRQQVQVVLPQDVQPGKSEDKTGADLRNVKNA